MKPRLSERQRGALAGAGLGLLLAALTNGLIFGLGFGEGGQDPAGADPGPINRLIFAIVPIVWLGLFAGMGAAVALLRSQQGRLTPSAAVTALLLANCALYPLYTGGFSSADAGLAGNYFTALLAVLAAASAWPRSRLAAILTIPVTTWVTLASIGLYATQTGRVF